MVAGEGRAGAHLELLVRPKDGHVGQLAGQNIVVGLEKRAALVHVVQHEQHEEDVLRSLEAQVVAEDGHARLGLLAHLHRDEVLKRDLKDALLVRDRLPRVHAAHVLRVPLEVQLRERAAAL